MRKLWKARGAVVGVLLLAGAVAACKGALKTYVVAPDMAKAALTGTTIPSIAFGAAAHFEPAVATPKGVSWNVLAGGEYSSDNLAFVKLNATVTAATGGAQVEVDVQPAEGPAGARAEKLLKENPAVAKLFRAIAYEQIDATLSRRPFRFANISGAMAVAVASLAPKLTEKLKNEAAAPQPGEFDKFDSAYKEDKLRH